MAAGFTIRTKKIKELREKLEKLAKKGIKAELLQPVINVDLEIDLNDINWKLFNQIEKFSPFGLENPRPVFMSKGVGVISVRAVGRERKHLKLKITANPQNAPKIKAPRRCYTLKNINMNNSSEVEELAAVFDAIGFNLGHFSKELSPGNLIDICFSIDKNVWNGKESLQLNVRDINC